jgi:hypothetical protein
MGVPPNMLEVHSTIPAVDFDACYQARRMMEIDGVRVPVISFEDLKKNKTAAGRDKDLTDIRKLQKRSSRKGL